MTGSGTLADPYLIYNVTDLQAIENDLTAYYELANDIDASATSGWNGGAGFAPISNFTGELDGKGYEVTDLHIDRPALGSNVGLFAQIGAAGVVKNLGLVDCNLTGSDAGGIVADNYGEINSCYTTGSVTATYGAGGICDDNEVGALIVDSYSTCTVSGAGAGGLCQTNSGTIRSCYATGNVSGNDGGGLVENNGGTIEKCYATGNVTAGDAGGLVERNDGTITNCYARGNILSATFGGGLVNTNTSSIDKCYSTGTIESSFLKGGLVRDTTASGTTTNSFWDTEASGEDTSDGGTGKTTAEMKARTTFADAGWDFDTIWEMRTDRNDGYAYFQWQFPEVAKVRKGNPNVDQLIYQHVERMDR